MDYPHNKDFLSSPRALLFPEIYETNSSIRDIVLDTMNYFLAHPEQFVVTPPEYQIFLKQKILLYFLQGPIHREVEEKLYTTEILKKMVNYLKETNGCDIITISQIINLSVYFLTEERKIFLIDEIMDLVMENKNVLLSHERFRECIKDKLTELSSKYPHARHYYNLLFPQQHTKRYEAPQEQSEGKYLRV